MWDRGKRGMVKDVGKGQERDGGRPWRTGD
jgi:hypothetical protein